MTPASAVARDDAASLRLLLAELERRTPRPAPPLFRDVLPASLIRHRHVQALADVLERVVRREIRRLMVLMPPRHWKSTIVSRHFIAHWLRVYPTTEALLGSYAHSLAQDHARAARAIYAEHGGQFAPDQAEKADWKTVAGGGLLAVGIGSGVTGRGGGLMVLDDSVKDAQEAASDAIARRNRDWYDSTWTTRAQGTQDGRATDVQIIIETLWPGKASLARYALEQEAAGDRPEGWTVLVLDAIRDPEPYDFPPTCTVLPDWRELGEPLCPDVAPLDKLLSIKAKRPFYFGALYQQRPKVRDGTLFKFDDFLVHDAAPVLADLVSVVRYWDMAGTDQTADNDPDATSGVLMARHRDGSTWVLDRATITAGVTQRDAFIAETARADRARFGSRVVQWFEEQAGIGGKAAMQALVRALAGHRVQSEPATGSKLLRAEPFASQVGARNVRLVRGPWIDAYRQQLCGFPFAAHDDDVDASSGAFSKVADDSAPRVGVTSFSL